MTGTGTVVRRAAVPAAIAAGVAALFVRYFEPFPNGWDQAEYAWCLRDGYLPHSPYLLFLLLGRLFALLFPPPVALSLLSAVSGLACLALIYSVGRALTAGAAGWPHRRAALAVTALLGFTYLFVREATTQDSYVLQTAILLGALRLALVRRPAAAVLSGAAFGLACATHNSTAFLLPAFTFAWWTFGGAGRVRRTFLALMAGGAVVAVFAATVYLLLPPPPEGSRLAFALRYLQGISAAKPALATVIETTNGTNAPAPRPSVPVLLARSVAALYDRLTNLARPASRLPIATGPIGFTLVHFLAAAGGLAVAFRRFPRAAWLWLAWTGPYFLYEVARSNPDYGTYVPFLLPPMAFLLAAAATAAGTWLGRRAGAPAGAAATAVLTLLALAPSLALLTRHADDRARDYAEDRAPRVLAMRWLGEHLPLRAVVVQPEAEWNANRTAYDLRGRAFVTRVSGRLFLFRPRGPFTPMNLTAYVPFTPETLEALLREGRPVYALEPDPLGAAADTAPTVEWRKAESLEGAPVPVYHAGLR